MRTADVMMGLVAAGVGLTFCYLVAELLSWRFIRASDQRAGVVLRELYKKLHARTKPYVARVVRRK